jgi:hypothetical protein
MDASLPVKYVLYAHLGYREKEDFEAWSDDTVWRDSAEEDRYEQAAVNGGGVLRHTSDLDVVRYLRTHLRELRRLLNAYAHEGLLVLFYSPGFPESLSGIADGLDRSELLKRHRSLRFAHALAQYVEQNLLADPELANRVRFVTALDLADLFGRMNWATAINLRWWFYGASAAMRYDAPKIVEAFVRLRLLGTGVPVFRLDFDVLFRERNAQSDYLGMSTPIASCIRAHQLRRDEASIATFILSASYDTGALQDPSQPPDFEQWSGAFATRVFPALPVVPDLLEKFHPGSTSEVEADSAGKPYTWDQYAVEAFNEPLARRFYGLAATGITSDGVRGIGKIGAHPLVSVISGALLCMSEGAILDLPPFSNFSLNVSWIDDHLKYSLHRELRHFTTTDLRGDELLRDAKLDSVTVQKARAPITNLPSYVLGSYLPTLLWGAIMDAWITPDILLKYRPEHLPDEIRAQWRSIPRRGRSGGVLTSALQTALAKGHIDKGEKQELRRRLVDVALRRANEVREEWASLTDGGRETFASIWAKGDVDKHFPGLDRRCRGMTEPDWPLTKGIRSPLDLNHFLYDDFRSLLDDVIDYIDWTLHWPQIVQMVRSVEQGTLRTDMSWRRSP